MNMKPWPSTKSLKLKQVFDQTKINKFKMWKMYQSLPLNKMNWSIDEGINKN